MLVLLCRDSCLPICLPCIGSVIFLYFISKAFIKFLMLIKHHTHHRLWKIVYKLHVGMKKESIEAASKNSVSWTANQWAELVAHPDTRGQFHDCLLNLEENEGFYLLSALANMTVTREPAESEFIQVCDILAVFR